MRHSHTLTGRYAEGSLFAVVARERKRCKEARDQLKSVAAPIAAAKSPGS